MHMIIARCSKVMLFEKGSVCVKRAFSTSDHQKNLLIFQGELLSLCRDTNIELYLCKCAGCSESTLYTCVKNKYTRSYSMVKPLFKHHSVLQLFLLLLSHKKLYHLCGLIKPTNKSTFQFYAFFIPLQYA